MSEAYYSRSRVHIKRGDVSTPHADHPSCVRSCLRHAARKPRNEMNNTYMRKFPALSLNQWWLVLFSLAAAYYLLWWLHLRPGVYTFDSGYYVQQVLTGNYTNQKPFMYARFLQLSSLGGRSFETAVVLQALLISVAAGRVLAIGIITRTHPVWLALAVLLLVNPYVANMASYVQNDVLFCIAMLLVLVETLHIARLGRLPRASFAVIAVFAPMAFFFRENGLLFVPLWILAIWFVVPRSTWLRMAGTALAASAACYVSVVGVDTDIRQDPLFSAIIHEVVGLARPAFASPTGHRLSPQTRQLIGEARLSTAVSAYWPFYWDTIGFMPGGGMMQELDQDRRAAIVKSFIRNDLPANLPTVAAHRVEVFLGATLARGAPVNPYAPPPNLAPALYSKKMARGPALANEPLFKINQLSHSSRGWTWNALLGVLVLLGLTIRGIWTHDRPVLLIAALLWLQAALILIAAPSAEYRYVFMLYLAPLLLLAQGRAPVGRVCNDDTSVQSGAPR